MTTNTRPYKITYNNKTLEGEFRDEELGKYFGEEWDFVDSKYIFRSPTNERLNIATFNLEDSFLSSTLDFMANTFRLNSTDYKNLIGFNQNGIELTSLVKQGFVKEIVLEKVDDNDLVSLLVSLLNITVPVNKIVFETNVEKDYSQRFPNLSDDGKVLTYNVGEQMVLPYLQDYRNLSMEVNTDFSEKRVVSPGAFWWNGDWSGLGATVNYTGNVSDNVTLTSTIYPKVDEIGPIFVANPRKIGNYDYSFVTLYSSDIEQKIQNTTVTLANTQITVDDLKARVMEGESEVTFSKTDVADNDNKTVFEILCLAGDLPPTVEKIIFKTDRVWNREPTEQL